MTQERDLALPDTQKGENYWIDIALSDGTPSERQVGLGLCRKDDWVDTPEGYEFWKNQYDRLGAGKNLTKKARKALERIRT